MLTNYLVVAHQTAVSGELLAALRLKLAKEPDATFTLVVPATPVTHLLTWSPGETADIAARRATEALEELRREGLPIAIAKTGASSPVTAVADELRLNPGTYSGVIIATHPPALSRWLRLDVVRRLRRLTNLPVEHVTADAHETAPPPEFTIVECDHLETEPWWEDDDNGERYLAFRCRVCGDLVEEQAAALSSGAWRP